MPQCNLSAVVFTWRGFCCSCPCPPIPIARCRTKLICKYTIIREYFSISLFGCFLNVFFFIFQCLSLPLWYISTLVPRVALDAGLSWYEGGVTWDTHMPLSFAAFLRYFITYIRSILLTYTGTHNIPLCIACLRRVTLGFFLLKPWVAVPGIAGMGGGLFPTQWPNCPTRVPSQPPAMNRTRPK